MTMRALILSASIAIPSIASGQDARPAGNLNRHDLPTAYVLENTGTETRGRLLQLDSQSVVLLVDGAERRFDLARVSRVSRRGDSLRNGAITGTIVGLVLGALSAGIADCPGARGSYTHCGAGTRLGMFAASVGIYAAIGTGVDALVQGRTILYQAPRVTASPGGRGAALAWRFAW